MDTDDLWSKLSQACWSTITKHPTPFSGKVYAASLPSPWGRCFIALAEESLCQLAFWDQDSEREQYQDQLHRDWPQADLIYNTHHVQNFLQQSATQQQGTLLLQGSPFQVLVWQTLLAVPFGHRLCYQELASTLGQASACRAVASAVAKNKIAYLIPCHRIVRKQGDTGNYRWGKQRKQALLNWESTLNAKPDFF